MHTISQITKKIISKKPFLLEMISANLINLTALARNIKGEIEDITLETVSIGSIVMALKRYKQEIDSKKIKFEDYMDQISNVMLVSDLVELTFENVSNIGEKQKQLSKLINSDNHYFLSYVKGISELTIIAGNKYAKDIEKIYAKDTVLGKIEYMSAIVLQLPPNNIDIPGLYYFIFKHLAWEGIPISEVVSTQNELIFLLKDCYVDKAFLLVRQLQ